jgi:hypothetical protein
VQHLGQRSLRVARNREIGSAIPFGLRVEIRSHMTPNSDPGSLRRDDPIRRPRLRDGWNRRWS